MDAKYDKKDVVKKTGDSARVVKKSESACSKVQQIIIPASISNDESDGRSSSQDILNSIFQQSEELSPKLKRILNSIAEITHPNIIDHLCRELVSLKVDNATKIRCLASTIHDYATADPKHSQVYAALCPALQRQLQRRGKTFFKLTMQHVPVTNCV